MQKLATHNIQHWPGTYDHLGHVLPTRLLPAPNVGIQTPRYPCKLAALRPLTSFGPLPLLSKEGKGYSAHPQSCTAEPAKFLQVSHHGQCITGCLLHGTHTRHNSTNCMAGDSLRATKKLKKDLYGAVRDDVGTIVCPGVGIMLPSNCSEGTAVSSALPMTRGPLSPLSGRASQIPRKLACEWT